jgi:hypothetical protein
MERLNKITVANVCGKIERSSVTEPYALMRVLALVSSMKEEETQYGPYMDFRGRFEATNLETGEVVESSRLIVPSIVEDLLAADVAALQNEGGGNVLARFEIGVKPSDRGSLGYQYTLKVEQAADENSRVDHFAALRLDGETAPALEAPKKASKK